MTSTGWFENNNMKLSKYKRHKQMNKYGFKNVQI